MEGKAESWRERESQREGGEGREHFLKKAERNQEGERNVFSWVLSSPIYY